MEEGMTPTPVTSTHNGYCRVLVIHGSGRRQKWGHTITGHASFAGDRFANGLH